MTLCDPDIAENAMGELHLIFTEEQVLVSKKAYASWREIQAEYDDYKASLGPWSEEATVSWLGEEYGDLAPSAQQQVEMLLSSNEVVRTVTFRE
jgi:hypothetical protein